MGRPTPMTELEFKRYCKHYSSKGYEEISRSSERAIFVKVHNNRTEFIELLIEEEQPRITILSDDQMELLMNMMGERE
jgi:hypothetical protein